MPLLWWFGEFLFSRNFLYPKPEVRGLRSEEVQGPRPRRERPVTARGLCHTRSGQPAKHFIQHNTVIYSSCVTHELVAFATSYQTYHTPNISSRNAERNVQYFTSRPYVVCCASSRVSGGETPEWLGRQWRCMYTKLWRPSTSRK